MYNFIHPTPIVVKLTDEDGFDLRQKAADFIIENQNKKGAERGSKEEQSFGALAEIVIRKKLGMPEINSADHPLAYDILLPGTKRQRKWILYICGWVSKKRVKREGVYLPRGSLTEQGNTWFTYRGQEIEFYHKNLNGLKDISGLFLIEREDVKRDENRIGDLNLTSVDALRITYDLVGRGILDIKYIDFIKEKIKIVKTVKPILHINQYYHLLNWLKEQNQITDREINKLEQMIQKVDYTGI